MRYYLIAGEASGDLHASNLIRGLAQCDKAAEFRFWGGEKMEEAALGKGLVRNYREGAIMGMDFLLKLPSILGNFDLCKKDIVAYCPDVVILIDYPGFNMRIARYCHRKGIKVFYYIAPKTWASREWRNRDLKRYVDRLFIVFPFEKDYFSARGIDFIYRGNPLLDAVDSAVYESMEAYAPYIAVLPGSRKGEISRMMPVCMQVAQRHLNHKFIIAAAPSACEKDFAPFIAGHENVRVEYGKTYSVIKGADAAIVNSGTASLETALIGTPQVVCWSGSGLTYFIAGKILHVLDRIKYISLGNLILDKLAFKELIQNEFNEENLDFELCRLLYHEPYRSEMISDYARIRSELGGTGASIAVAQAMIEEINKR